MKPSGWYEPLISVSYSKLLYLLPALAGFFWKRPCGDSGDEDEQNTSSSYWAIPQFGKAGVHLLCGARWVASGLAPLCSPASSPATANYTHQRNSGIRLLLLHYQFNTILYWGIHMQIYFRPHNLICRPLCTLRNSNKIDLVNYTDSCGFTQQRVL